MVSAVVDVVYSVRLFEGPIIEQAFDFRRFISSVRQKHWLAWENAQIGDNAVDFRFAWVTVCSSKVVT